MTDTARNDAGRDGMSGPPITLAEICGKLINKPHKDCKGPDCAVPCESGRKRGKKCPNPVETEQTLCPDAYSTLALSPLRGGDLLNVYAESAPEAGDIVESNQSPGALRTGRLLALCAANLTGDAVPLKVGWHAAWQWTRFLMEKAGPHFLCVHRAEDSTFYDLDGRHPLPRSAWKNGWDAKLPWLTNPEQLTIPELELALAVFDWNTERPALVWWLKRHPHFRARIEDFLERRYCWPLLGFMDEANVRLAQKDTPAEAMPQQAMGPVLRMWMGGFAALPQRYYRLLVIVFIGVVGVSGDLTFGWFINKANGLGLLIAWGLAAVPLFFLCFIEVRKQNAVLFDGISPRLPRVWGLYCRVAVVAAFTGLAVSLAMCSMPQFAGIREYPIWYFWKWDQYPVAVSQACGLGAVLLFLLRSAARGFVGATLGLVITWLFQDKALTEPV